MQKRIIGKDLEVSAVGLGCMGMSHAYGSQCTPDEAKNLIERLLQTAARFLTQRRSTASLTVRTTTR